MTFACALCGGRGSLRTTSAAPGFTCVRPPSDSLGSRCPGSHLAEHRLTQQPLDHIPLIVVATLCGGLTLVFYEVGYRIGTWRERRATGEVSGPTGMIVGSILALMAFLLAIATGMAADRFDARRGLVLQEANSIGTTLLRAEYLPQPYSAQLTMLLHEYVPLRIVQKQEGLHANIERSVEIQNEMWAITERLAQEHGDLPVVAIFIESLNETIDLHESRITAGLYSRVPPTIIWFLVAGVIFSVGMVGYNAGLTGRRSTISAVVLAVALSAVLCLVVDLDRPSGGLIRTNQQPLIDLRDSLKNR
jgi:hypothetical protein